MVTSMNGLDLWRLCDELSVFQAAILTAGGDPGDFENGSRQKPLGFEAAQNAISNALRRGSIEGNVVPMTRGGIDEEIYQIAIPDTVDIYSSRVELESLRKWLSSRGLSDGFFFPNSSRRHDYLDPDHPRYAPKLAAAVRAWMALDGESSISGKSPKQALTKWLREHAREFGLTDEDGKPNETGIEEAAKVANWQPTGGAPKTPGANPPAL